MRVFLDVDGVLANFNKGAFEALGLEYNYHHPALNEWHWYEYFGISLKKLNAVCDIGFWANLEWIHDGKQILDVVESRFDDIYLLTTPMPHPGSGTGKILWIEKHLPRYAKRTIITQAPKHILAGPDCLLIDDRDENVAEFVAAGGVGILISRPWNRGRGWADDTLEVVKNSLEEIR